MADLKIILLAPFVNENDIGKLKQKVEEFVRLNQEFKIERIEYSDYAKRPIEEMMVDALLEISKKLESLKPQE